jgi:hypothetical protein
VAVEGEGVAVSESRAVVRTVVVGVVENQELKLVFAAALAETAVCVDNVHAE